MLQRLYATAVIFGLSCTIALAATISATFNVQIQIQQACSTLTANTMAFGNQNILASTVDATASVSLVCTNSTPFTISFDKGINGTSTLDRQMRGGPANEAVTYQLYQDAARTVIWGETTDARSGTGSGVAQAFTVYGRVPAQTTPAGGSYSDTITVTVTY